MAVLVDLHDASVRHADRVLFDHLSLTVTGGDRVGVVGINGTGKSTLLRVIAGLDRSEGQVRRGRGARVGYLEQEPSLAPGSVRQAVGPGWESEALLSRLGMAADAGTDVSQLSGGQAKRVALATVLARPAELLVLDEPTNHLDLRAVAWLERWLLDFRGGLVLVTHDRHLLDRVTTLIIELDRGRPYAHEGGYASYLAARAEREEKALSSDASRRNLARRELAWLQRGAPARTRKPQARIDAAMRLVSGRPEAAARAGQLELAMGTPRLGDKVIECSEVAYRYGSEVTPVLSGVDLLLGPSEALGLVGANGSGKSTLLDILAGRRVPTFGRVERGPTVVTGYYDQRSVDLDPDARVRDLVAGATRPPGTPEDTALMDRFWFTGSLQFAPTRTLSGGERRRLQLLLVLAARPNVLILDEPTNDLDLDTLRILEDFLDEWPGALVVVSHDRTFLSRTTERLVELRSGTLKAIPGGIEAWMARVEPADEKPDRSPRRAGVAPLRVTEPPRRSSSTISRKLREAEKEMSRLTRQRDGLGEGLAAAGEDHLELARIGRELAAVQVDLVEWENRWLALAEEKETTP